MFINIFKLKQIIHILNQLFDILTRNQFWGFSSFLELNAHLSMLANNLNCFNIAFYALHCAKMQIKT